MKMKKTIAGILASVVAVSAMATSMVSATTVKQEAKDTTWTLKGDNKWKATWQTKLDGTAAASATQTASNTLFIDFASGAFTFDSGKNIANTIATTDFSYDAYDDDDVEISSVVLTVRGTSASNSSMNETQTVELEKLNDANPFTFPIIIYGTNVTAIQDDGITMSRYAAGGALDITLTYIVKDKTTYGSKSKAEDGKDMNGVANKDSRILTSTAVTSNTTLTANTPAAVIATELSMDFTAAVTTVGSEADAVIGSWLSNKCVIADDGDDGVTLDQDFFGTGANTVSFGAIKTNLDYAMKTALGGTKGATITLTFAAPDDDSDTAIDGPSWNFADTVKEIGIMVNQTGKLQSAATVDDNNSALVFDWDTIIKNSGLTINSTGLIWGLELGASQKAIDAELVLESVKVSVPAKEFEDLSAGEPTTDAASAITTAATDAAATEATTAPAANPGTGNAPIALAVIPVAIVAAAIIAKKRG